MLPHLILLTIAGVVAWGHPSRRVVHGTELTPGEIPYLGILEIHSTSWFTVCGAVLVAPDKVITAAHCLSGDIHLLRVVMGEHDIQTLEGSEQIRTVTNSVLHPDYNGLISGYPNDVAILTLNAPVNTSSNFVSTIPLAAKGDNFDGQGCTISGWGSIHPGGVVERQTVPTKASFNAISHTVCTNMWQPSHTIHPGHICMFSPTGEEACHYDYGGPMVCGGVLAGIISWGDIFCDGRHPTVSSSIAYYHDWITSHL